MNFQRLNKLERQVNKTKSEMNDFNREQVIANSSFTKVEHAIKYPINLEQSRQNEKYR